MFIPLGSFDLRINGLASRLLSTGCMICLEDDGEYQSQMLPALIRILEGSPYLIDTELIDKTRLHKQSVDKTYFNYYKQNSDIIKSIISKRMANLASFCTDVDELELRKSALAYIELDDPNYDINSTESQAALVFHNFIFLGLQWLVDIGIIQCVYQEINKDSKSENNTETNQLSASNDEDEEIDFDGDPLDDGAQTTLTELLLNNMDNQSDTEMKRIRIRLLIRPEDIDKDYYAGFTSRERTLKSVVINSIYTMIDISPLSWKLEDFLLPFKERGKYRKKLLYPQIYEDIHSIYTTLNSPNIDSYLKYGNGIRENMNLMKYVVDSKGPFDNMRSTLFLYQRKTLWKMLQKELFPQYKLDVDLLKIKCPVNFKTEVLDVENEKKLNSKAVLKSFYEHANQSKKTVYFKNSTYQIFNDPIIYEETTGGIICEEMGTGKTCICITLILLTSHQISKPPVDCAGYKVRCELMPEMAGYRTQTNIDEVIIDEFFGVRKLTEICVTNIQLNRRPYKHWKHLFSVPITNMFVENPSYYIKEPTRSVRDLSDPQKFICGTRIYLSSATLIVVPDTLIDQWQMEIYKHIKDGVLKVLILSNNSKQDPIPPVNELLTYDIVIISNPRFGREYSKSNFIIDKRNCCCSCPVVPDSFNVRDCNCKGGFFNGKEPSVLQRIKWLRLIVDEGHTMANRAEASSQVAMAALLECSRRWICSGTPMPSLTNKKIAQIEEQQNIEKLGSLLVNFLQVEPFKSNREMFRNIILKPFLDRKPNSQKILRMLMERIQIRNNISVVNKDVKLPPLYEKIVPLHLSRHQRLTQNIVRSFIFANAVLSEREHQDYYFHPLQQQALNDVITNLQLSNTWWSGPGLIETAFFTLFNVRSTLKKVREGLKTYPDDDIKLLEQVECHIIEALNDSLWRNLSIMEDLPILVENPSLGLRLEAERQYLQYASSVKLYGSVNRELLDSFSWCYKEFPKGLKLLLDNEENSKTDSVPHEVKKRKVEQNKAVTKTKDIKDAQNLKCEIKPISVFESDTYNSLIPVRAGTALQYRELTKYHLKKMENNDKMQVDDDHHILEPGLKEEEFKKNDINNKRKADNMIKSMPIIAHTEEYSIKYQVPAIKLLKNGQRMGIVGTASAKYSYIINQILKFNGKEKILIYAQHDNDIYYLHEICDLLRVRSLMFHGQMKVTERSRNITTFNTSQNVWVMIMDARLGSWGIDLSSVTRVFFFTPLWRTDMERQAVKRAHRIGSKKPVYVETIIIRDTFEEALIKRRMELSTFSDILYENEKSISDARELQTPPGSPSKSPITYKGKSKSGKSIINENIINNKLRNHKNFSDDGKMRKMLLECGFIDSLPSTDRINITAVDEFLEGNDPHFIKSQSFSLLTDNQYNSLKTY